MEISMDVLKAMVDLFLGSMSVPHTRVSSTPTNLGWRIVVLDRGYIYVGNCSFEAEGRLLLMTSVSNIRLWGTTKGLGELVHGPTSTTILDTCGNLVIPVGSIISIMEIKEDSWKR